MARGKTVSEVGRLGGLAYAENHTPEQRAERARRAGKASWEGLSPEEHAARVEKMRQAQIKARRK